jgi:alpha-L-arabinofuranosidase
LLGTVGVDKPLVSSGSPTYPLDVTAALSQDRHTLTVAVENPSDTAKQLVNVVGGAGIAHNGRKWSIVGPDINSRNVAGGNQAIQLVESQVGEAGASMAVATLSFSRRRQ